MTQRPQRRSAAPRCCTGHISASTPPVMHSGAPPNTPEKNRVMSRVWISFAVAVAHEKTAKPNVGIRRAGLRPKASDIGAQRRGPNAFLTFLSTRSFLVQKLEPVATYPKRKRDIPRRATSVLTPKCFSICGIPELKLLFLRVSSCRRTGEGTGNQHCARPSCAHRADAV